MTGTPDGAGQGRYPVADIAAGMYAYGGMITALYERGRTGAAECGRGEHAGHLVEWMGFPLYYTYGGAPPAAGRRRARQIAPYGPFPAGDGKAGDDGPPERAGVGGASPARFSGRPGLADDARLRGQRRPDRPPGPLERSDRPVRGAHRATSWPPARRGPAAPTPRTQREVGDVWAHPQLAARGRWHEVGTPAGPVPALRAARPRRPGAADGPGAGPRRAHPGRSSPSWDSPRPRSTR